MDRDALALAPGELELARLGRLADRLLATRAFVQIGSHAQRRRAGRGLEFLGLRDFAPGDDPRRVDWRASARARRIQLRESADERASAWHLLVDRSASMGARGGAKWRLAFPLAAAWAYLLLRGGHRVSLATWSSGLDATLPPGRGRRQYLRIVRALADTVPRRAGGGSALARAARVGRGRVGYAIVSDFLAADAMTPALDTLLASGAAVQAVQVLAADECALGPASAGAARVVDVESGEARLVARDAESDALARARLAVLETRLAHHCVRRAIPLTSAHSDEAWSDVLTRHLLRLERRRA